MEAEAVPADILDLEVTLVVIRDITLARTIRLSFASTLALERPAHIRTIAPMLTE